MANNDTSSYTLRWNEVLKDLEYSSGLNWITTGVMAGGGINQLTGDVTAGPGTGSQAASLSATRLQEIFVPIAADPGTPVEGQVWYNTTTHAWKGYDGTDVVTFTVA